MWHIFGEEAGVGDVTVSGVAVAVSGVAVAVSVSGVAVAVSVSFMELSCEAFMELSCEVISA